MVDALRCAVEVQREMTGRNAGVPPDNRIELRIGINVGDIVVEDGDIFGDGVNVAARLEALAEPGGICVSARVQEDAAGKLDLAFEDIGEQQLKNIARPVRVYRVVPERLLGDAAAGSGPAAPRQAVDRGTALRQYERRPEQEYFADGMVEEIITALSRIRWLFVIARNSSFTYKGQAVDVKQVGRELGVRYVLEGSVRKARRPRAHHRAADRRAKPARISGPTASTARLKTCSTFRTRSRSASPGSSSRPCRPPRSRAPPTVRRAISPPTTLYLRACAVLKSKGQIRAGAGVA